MSQDWLEKLEADLQESMECFSKTNSYQDPLLTKKRKKDNLTTLKRQQESIKKEAKKKREVLINIAHQIDEWRSRKNRARKKNAKDLSKKVDQHLQDLMKTGRKFWLELNELGNQFTKIDKQIDQELKNQINSSDTDEEKWIKLETEHELNNLRSKLN